MICAPHRPKAVVPKELLPPGDGYDEDERLLNSGGDELQKYHPKGFSLRKVLPLSGILCFGSYCNFDVRAKVTIAELIFFVYY